VTEQQFTNWQYTRAPLIEGIELEVTRRGFDGSRSVKVTDGQMFFTDCEHPAQNAYCCNESIEAWRVKT